MRKTSFIIDELGGYCPVQASGKIDGLPFYFRARGNRWSFAITPKDGDPVRGSLGYEQVLYYHEEPFGVVLNSAGYMSHAAAKGFIQQCIKDFRYQEEQ